MGHVYFRTGAVLVFFTFLFPAACTKDDDISPEEALTGTDCWALVKVEFLNPSDLMWTEDMVDSCDADDCYDFNSDGSFVFDEGVSICNPMNPQSYNGSWNISPDERVLTLVVPPADTTRLAVVSFSESVAVLEQDFGITRIRSTFRAK